MSERIVRENVVNGVRQAPTKHASQSVTFISDLLETGASYPPETMLGKTIFGKWSADFPLKDSEPIREEPRSVDKDFTTGTSQGLTTSGLVGEWQTFAKLPPNEGHAG